ncbi:hypothetical protein AB0C33_49995 [Nonomuraea sp. NPDC048881]|uniref:hypothetical protein n=1 Tax=Nonomuraea sp. NPDC048881 TaxID=3155030 RepID=UPI0033E5434C
MKAHVNRVLSKPAALAWTGPHHTWIHPISGARTLDQLTDNLAACHLRVPPEVVERLDRASAFPLGSRRASSRCRESSSTALRSAASTAGRPERRVPAVPRPQSWPDGDTLSTR